MTALALCTVRGGEVREGEACAKPSLCEGEGEAEGEAEGATMAEAEAQAQTRPKKKRRLQPKTSMATAAVGVSEKQSSSLIKNLTNVLFNAILYQRGILEKDNFTCRPMNGMSLWMIDSSKASPEGLKIQSWLCEGVCDAMEKRYLKRMDIIVADPIDELFDVLEENSKLIERYSFDYDYAEDGSVRNST